MQSPDNGYRRLNDDLCHDYGIYVNDKKVLHICRARDIRSTIKYNKHGCTRQTKKQYLAKIFWIANSMRRNRMNNGSPM